MTAGACPRRRPASGLSMVEVLVTVLVVATGVLGVAKLQAAALASTQTSRLRSLVALQTGSLASAMVANPRYWRTSAAPAEVTVRGGTVTESGHVLAAGTDCVTTSCTPEQLAAHDLRIWAESMQAHFPTHVASVRCTHTEPQPAHCTIDVSWTEKSVAINRSTALSPAAMSSTQTYNLYVEP